MAFPVFMFTFFQISLVAAQCSKPPVIFNFGDSNSDTGGGAALLGGPFVYPDGRTFFQEPTGRFCDGRLIIDFLCESLDTKYLTPFTGAVDRNFSNGVNFALSGSGIASATAYPFPLNVQILEFIRFRNRSIKLCSRGHQNLLGEDDFNNALYTICWVLNDLTYGYKHRTYDSFVKGLIPFAISRIRSAIQDIYHLGGKNFWVHGVGPLGCLPQELATRNGSKRLDKYGCISEMNELIKQFNLELDVLCQQMRIEMENSTIVYVDVYSIKYDIITSSSSYGFEHPLMACCGYGGPPYNIDPVIECQSVCPQAQRRISWDGVHYTEAANAIAAFKILSTNCSSPPLPFNFFCNTPSC
ncbi:GDSL-like Lipase/Acylhydrolase superfamily protein [Perilla frutescens var. frutescens]|nr:GDSL-like Lipase/Acylhydrolase superfamily protein [Perilla frutescens var. frutescens]